MSIFKVRHYSPALHRQVNFSVCLPTDDVEVPGLPRRAPTDAYRTVYLLHGHGGNHEDWLYGTSIDMFALKYNVAIVMPSIENSFYLDDPIREAYYARYLSEELVAFTRKVFPLSARREDTAIGGLSMGGYGALRNGLLYNNTYGAVVALSSAFITDEISGMQPGEDNGIARYDYYRHVFGELSTLPGSDRDPKALASKLKETGETIPAIYMACGTEDFLLEQNRDVDWHLTACGIPHEYHESAGVHDWHFWDEYVEKALDWYTSATN